MTKADDTDDNGAVLLSRPARVVAIALAALTVFALTLGAIAVWNMP